MASACDIGLIGLAVMGENLALNIESRGYRVAVFNRTTTVVDHFITGRAAGKNFVGCHSVEDLVKSLAKPRKVMLMVKAGPAVDALIEQLIPLLSPGDILIDGGNTHYVDTERRTKDNVESKGLLFVGSGVSGGEEGALKGPSMMPGGSPAAWPAIKPIFQAIAAKVGPKADIPCCEWVGPRGAGHYGAMVRHGIEYGDMQLICEAYFVLKQALNLSNEEFYDVFNDWNRGELDSYLIEITRDIFSARDPETGQYLVDLIKDTAGAKGTGKWMSQLALDLGVPSTLERSRGSLRPFALRHARRTRARQPGVSQGQKPVSGDRKEFIAAVPDGRCTASKICGYTQGFGQLGAAAGRREQVAAQLRRTAAGLLGGAVASFICARFLDRIRGAFDANPKLSRESAVG